jgi:glycosyltransferase involved in cell wall biosynthesis
MRLLFLSFAFPLPADNGHRMRTWSLLQALADEGHDLSLLTFGQPSDLEAHSSDLRGVCQKSEIVPLVLQSLSSATHYFARLVGSFSSQPYAVRRFVSRTMRERIQHHLSHGAFDGVICDGLHSAVNLPHTDVPVILNSHNVEHLILRRYVEVERNPVKRLYARFEMYKLREWERRVCRQANIVLACSETDLQTFRSLVPVLCGWVVPNVVDAQAYTPEEEGTTATILFQGGMDWFPNRDAVAVFVERIFPLLQQSVPHIPFVVAGRNPSSGFIEQFRAVQGVQFLENVLDMRAEIAKAAVCVVPLRIGSGTRLKIIEAAAMGKAIVSTRVGAEGLDFVNGQEIILAEEPDQFACAIADLIEDPSRRRAMGLAARRRVEAQYSVPALRCAVRKVLSNCPLFRSDSYPVQLEPAQTEVRR